MLTDNNQIFRNWFVIIYRHLAKVSAQIIPCIIFEHNELSITLSTLWDNPKASRKRETERKRLIIKNRDKMSNRLIFFSMIIIGAFIKHAMIKKKIIIIEYIQYYV